MPLAISRCSRRSCSAPCVGTTGSSGRRERLLDAAARARANRARRVAARRAAAVAGAAHPASTQPCPQRSMRRRCSERASAGGLVNAVLRRFQREREQLEQAALEVDEARFAHPRWLIDALRADHPRAWESILAANNAAPPLWLRVNLARTTRARLSRQAGGRRPCRCRCAGRRLRRCSSRSPSGSRRCRASPRARCPCRTCRRSAPPHCSSSSPASGCSTPARRPAARRVTSSKRSAAAARSGPSIATPRESSSCGRTSNGSASPRSSSRAMRRRRTTWWDGTPFDRILIDAPCSATGVIRRHPDIKVLRRPGDVDRALALQARLLRALWPLLAPGGRLRLRDLLRLAARERGPDRAHFGPRSAANRARRGCRRRCNCCPRRRAEMASIMLGYGSRTCCVRPVDLLRNHNHLDKAAAPARSRSSGCAARAPGLRGRSRRSASRSCSRRRRIAIEADGRSGLFRSAFGRCRAARRRLSPERRSSPIAFRRKRWTRCTRACRSASGSTSRSSIRAAGGSTTTTPRCGSLTQLEYYALSERYIVRQHQQRRPSLVRLVVRGARISRPNRAAASHRYGRARRRPRILRPAARLARPGAVSGAAAVARLLAARLGDRERVVSMAIAKRIRSAFVTLLAVSGDRSLADRTAVVHARHREHRRLRAAAVLDPARSTPSASPCCSSLIVSNLWQLVRDHRRHVPGSRLRARMVSVLVHGRDHAARRRVHLLRRVHQSRHRQLAQRRRRERLERRARARPERCSASRRVTGSRRCSGSRASSRTSKAASLPRKLNALRASSEALEITVYGNNRDSRHRVRRSPPRRAAVPEPALPERGGAAAAAPAGAIRQCRAAGERRVPDSRGCCDRVADDERGSRVRASDVSDGAAAQHALERRGGRLRPSRGAELLALGAEDELHVDVEPRAVDLAARIRVWRVLFLAPPRHADSIADARYARRRARRFRDARADAGARRDRLSRAFVQRHDAAARARERGRACRASSRSSASGASSK